MSEPVVWVSEDKMLVEVSESETSRHSIQLRRGQALKVYHRLGDYLMDTSVNPTDMWDMGIHANDKNTEALS